jgi:hypothetical protein
MHITYMAEFGGLAKRAWSHSGDRKRRVPTGFQNTSRSLVPLRHLPTHLCTLRGIREGFRLICSACFFLRDLGCLGKEKRNSFSFFDGTGV